MRIEIRRAEPGDYKAVQQVHAQPRAIWGTLQVPRARSWRWPACTFTRNRRGAGTWATSAWRCTTSLEIEGTQRKYAFRDGAYVDAYCMARVR